jgi:DNA-binding MarR family transcriptional regulator
MTSKSDLALANDLRQVIKKWHRRLRKRVRDAGHWSEAEENVMRTIIERKEVSPSELCIAHGLSSQFVSQVLNHLEEMDYISRTPSLEDKRKTLVSLSSRGKLLVENMKHDNDEWVATIISKQYTAQQKETIRQAVGLLAAMPELS